MLTLNPDAVIARWMNHEGTHGFMLQANGDLVVIERNARSDMWSPPLYVAQLQSAVDPLHAVFAQLMA